MSISSIWSIDRTLSGATTLGQSGPGSDGNELRALLESHYLIVLCHIRDICWVKSYPSAEMQLVYSAVTVEWAMHNFFSYIDISNVRIGGWKKKKRIKDFRYLLSSIKYVQNKNVYAFLEYFLFLLHFRFYSFNKTKKNSSYSQRQIHYSCRNAHSDVKELHICWFENIYSQMLV